MKTKEAISSLINCLTSDEDLRQELWLHYLSGNSADTFARHLQRLTYEYNVDVRLRSAMWTLMNNPISPEFTTIIEHFSEFEQSLMCMLLLGLSISEISAIKGISEVRIRQAISAIRYNSSWEKLNGTEKAPHR